MTVYVCYTSKENNLEVSIFNNLKNQTQVIKCN